jgi:hypothetical protein
MKKSCLHISFYILVLCGLSSCIKNPVQRYEDLNTSAFKYGFVKHHIVTEQFTLASWAKLDKDNPHLIIYIEGDGLAWLSKRELSKDPSPIHPLAFQLSSVDPRQNVVYLARPCQYTLQLNLGRNCEKKIWSSHRFSQSVINSINEGIDFWKNKTNAKTIELIGFSGGGAIAVLVSSLRADVLFLRTIAGNLDHASLNRHHKVSPLSGSLNAIEVAPEISHIPQVHYVGGKDKIVPSFIAKKFVLNLNCKKCGKVVVVPEATHLEGWVQNWHKLLELRP